MMLTFRKLLFVTIAILLLDVTYMWVRENYGLMHWMSPATLKFWTKEIALLLAWTLYFIEKK